MASSAVRLVPRRSLTHASLAACGFAPQHLMRAENHGLRAQINFGGTAEPVH